MKLTRNNTEEFTNWELARPREARLKSMLWQAKNIKQKYETTKMVPQGMLQLEPKIYSVPPQRAVIENLTYRVYLMFKKHWSPRSQSHLANLVFKLDNYSDIVRGNLFRATPYEYPGSSRFLEYEQGFKESLDELITFLTRELEGEDYCYMDMN